MRGYTRIVALAACLALVLALVIGCGKKEEATSTTSPTAQPTAKSAAKAKGPKIAGIVFQEDQFFRMVQAGMKEAAAKEGVDLRLENSGGTQDKEVSLIDTYIADKVDAICIAPLNAKSSIAPLKRASDAGIKIVTFDSSIDADFPVSDIKSDQVLLGKYTGEAAAKFIKEKLGGKATIAILQYKSFLPETSLARTKGFTDEMKKLPGVRIVANQDAWEAPKAADVAQSMLTKNPDLNIIWSANEGGTVGSVTAVRSAGKAGKVFVFGTDMSSQMGDFLLADDNVLQAVTAQKPIEIGQAAIEAAVKAVKGEKVEKKVSVTGELFTRADTKKIDDFKASVKNLE